MAIDTQTLKARLEEELERVTKQLNSLGVHNKRVTKDWIPTPEDVDTPEPDQNIVADRAEDWEERRGTLEALETRFNNINRALKKIGDGVFGTCEVCDNEIEEKRLQANPAARTCEAHLESESQLPL